MPESRTIIGDHWIGALSQFDQLVARAIEAVVVGVKLQAFEDALHLSDVIGVFRADQEVNVHEA